ncbi:MAG TPA: hypothetical protein VGJ94_15525 [Syntrophorhabdaceae bacterium]
MDLRHGLKLNMKKEYSLYLGVGDRVIHKRFTRWGMGVVTEERSSTVPGGFCYVRIVFQDGKVRVFDNDFKSGNCCYYAGIQRLDDIDLG